MNVIGATRASNGYLGAFFRRALARRGHLKALVAVAHKLVLIVFQVLKKKESYRGFGADCYELKNIAKVAARTVHRLGQFGYEVPSLPRRVRLNPLRVLRVSDTHLRRNYPGEFGCTRVLGSGRSVAQSKPAGKTDTDQF